MPSVATGKPYVVSEKRQSLSKPNHIIADLGGAMFELLRGRVQMSKQSSIGFDLADLCTAAMLIAMQPEHACERIYAKAVTDCGESDAEKQEWKRIFLRVDVYHQFQQSVIIALRTRSPRFGERDLLTAAIATVFENRDAPNLIHARAVTELKANGIRNADSG